MSFDSPRPQFRASGNKSTNTNTPRVGSSSFLPTSGSGKGKLSATDGGRNGDPSASFTNPSPNAQPQSATFEPSYLHPSLSASASLTTSNLGLLAPAAQAGGFRIDYGLTTSFMKERDGEEVFNLWGSN